MAHHTQPSWRVHHPTTTYANARQSFTWDLPEDYHPATDFLHKHDPDAPALYQTDPDGTRTTFTFGEIDARSSQLAHGLRDLGVEPGDRVGIVLPQKPETPITHLACWKLGAISIPLTTLFGPDALTYRLTDSSATAVVYDTSVRDTIVAIRDDCPDLDHTIEVDGDTPNPNSHSFTRLRAGNSDTYPLYETGPETPAVIMYTSGSTGPPKGVFHSYAVWAGRAAAAAVYFEHNLDETAVCWTPSDWAWGAALGGTLFAAWHHGTPIVGAPAGKFDPDWAFRVLEEFGVTHTFIPPTALRMLMDIPHPTETYELSLSTIASVGEPLTPEILDWVATHLPGVTINEFYGQTELNLVVANSSPWFETKPGSMGKPLPGYDVAILDPVTHEELPLGEAGELAVRPHDDVVFFNEYWNNPEKTKTKQHDDWYLTGDIVAQDDDEYLWFKSRADDIIITSGYRVGPREVESAILDHDDVEQVGVIGISDDTRGEIIKAYVQPTPGVLGTAELKKEIQSMVRTNLAAYEYPREIEFVSELPQTTTGKIQRKALRDQEQAA